MTTPATPITTASEKPIALNQQANQQDAPGFGSPFMDPFGTVMDAGMPLVGVYGFSFGASGIPWNGYSGFGSIAMNPYGVPLGSFPNYWMMDRNPTAALSQGAADAPIKKGEGAFETRKKIEKSKAKEIVEALEDKIQPFIRDLLTMFCRSRDDGFACVKHTWIKDADGYITLSRNQALNPFLTRAVKDEHGNIIGVTSNGQSWEDIRQFTWVPYDARYGYIYGRSRKLNYLKPWVNQEYLYDITQLATNVLVRPLPSISVPYTPIPPNAATEFAENARRKNAASMGNGRKMLNGLMAGEGVIFPNPFAENVESMIKNGVSPKDCMPYTIEFFKQGSDSGEAIKKLHELFDNGIISGHLVLPRTVISARQGGKADAAQHTDTTTNISEVDLDFFAECLNDGVIDTFVEQNYGSEYVGQVYWKPSPVVDAQLQLNNEIVKAAFKGPQGFQNMMRIIDIAATMNKAGMKTTNFDQDALLEEDKKLLQEQQAVQVDNAKIGAKEGVNNAPRDGKSKNLDQSLHLAFGDEDRKEREKKLLLLLLPFFDWMETDGGKASTAEEQDDALQKILLEGMGGKKPAGSEADAALYEAAKRLAKLVNDATRRGGDKLPDKKTRARNVAGDAVFLGDQVVFTALNAGKKVKWHIEDSAACSICLPLDGLEVEAGQDFAPGIRYPVLDTHSNCRCWLTAVEL